MSEKRVPLYERLPEIYRVRDQEQDPPGQLESYLSLVENAFGAVHENIEALYDDLFIETCDDWVIPYIGDLLGVSHLKGDEWTLRADVADTIALRRRKGTLASIERLTYNLTQWGVHCVELRENCVWSQHLNHQRPDAGGLPPYSLSSITRFTPIRGGTVTLRDPAMLSLVNTPFDPFAHIPDLRPPAMGNVRYNLPNLAIFLWRLNDYRVKAARPMFREYTSSGGVYAVRFDVNPTGEPVRLFNTYQFDSDRDPPLVTQVDETPGPIHPARLIQDSPAGNPESYVAVDTYNPLKPELESRDIADVGFQLHLPEPEFAGQTWPGSGSSIWKIRSENLCAWESGIQPQVGDREIIIDPEIGRVIIGVASESEAIALKKHLLITYTYGAVGPVGSHPVTRTPAPRSWGGDQVVVKTIDYHKDQDPDAFQKALGSIPEEDSPLVIEIRDSMTHVLDIGSVTGTVSEDGGPNLNLNHALIIRAAHGQRPIIMLKSPLRFRAADVSQARKVTVRLEGLYLTRYETEISADSFPIDQPLIARAAINSLELKECTLDPGGHLNLDGSRSMIRDSLRLRKPYGFDAEEEVTFDQTPEIVIQRCISGPALIDQGYHLSITDSIMDAGRGVGDDVSLDPEHSFAVSGATDPVNGWGPPTQVNGLTAFGRMRVESINGKGGIWVHALEVLDNQKGCIRYSYFSGAGDRLPQNLGCVRGFEAELRFVTETFGSHSYAQIAHTSDSRIKEQGPGNDAMGAFGFLLEAHKWRNIQIRFREFLPVGIRPLLIPVT